MKVIKKVFVMSLACVMLISTSVGASARYTNQCPTCSKSAYSSGQTSCPYCHAMVTKYYCRGGHSWTACGHFK